MATRINILKKDNKYRINRLDLNDVTFTLKWNPIVHYKWLGLFKEIEPVELDISAYIYYKDECVGNVIAGKSDFPGIKHIGNSYPQDICLNRELTISFNNIPSKVDTIKLVVTRVDTNSVFGKIPKITLEVEDIFGIVNHIIKDKYFIKNAQSLLVFTLAKDKNGWCFEPKCIKYDNNNPI